MFPVQYFGTIFGDSTKFSEHSYFMINFSFCQEFKEEILTLKPKARQNSNASCLS